MYLLNRLSLQSKLVLALLLVSLGSILAVSYIGYTNAESAMRKSIMNQLEGRRAEKTQQITAFLGNLRNQVVNQSDRRFVTEGIREFRDAFQALEGVKMDSAAENKLEEFYKTVFIPGLTKNLDAHPVLEQYLPQSPISRYLQYNYIATNPNPYGKGQDLEAATDGSAYSEIHRKYHSQYHKFVQQFGFEDMFLIDAETLDIVYSYQKSTEFATNLEHGPYADTNLGNMVRALRKTKDRDDYKMADFEAYRPNLGNPSAFIGSPIYNGNKMIGILVFQFPIDEITRLMSGNFKWKEQGLRDTGEVYLVGSDYTMRSRSRFMTENPKEVLKNLRVNGIAEHTVSQIERQGNVLLVLPVRTPSVEKALQGKQGVEEIRDYRDMPVISAYGPVELDSVRWAIIAEMDVAEAYEPVIAFSHKVLAAGTGIALLTSLLALYLARFLVRPLKKLTEAARRISAGEEDVKVEVNTRDEFQELGDAFNEMSASLKLKTEELRQQVHENEELLLNILPAPVAAQLRDGKGHTTQRFTDVTVLIAYTLGFEQVSQMEGADASLNLLQDIVASFDDAADKFGVEKVKTVGSSYLAVCGLSVQRPDHTNRMIEFAQELVRIVNRFNRDRGKELVLEIGINTGPVVGGIVGRSKFIYDLWGDTVTVAGGLRSDGVTSIQVTQAVYERMRDLHSFVAANEFEVKGKGNFSAWTLAN